MARESPHRLLRRITGAAALLLAFATAVAAGDAAGSASADPVPTAADGAADPVRPVRAEPRLVGLVRDGRDQSVGLSMLSMDDGVSDRIGIEGLLAGLGLRAVRLADGGWQADTPLGVAKLSASDVSASDGVDYADLATLARVLGIGLRFDEAAAAIVATTHWDLLAQGDAPPPATPVVRPDDAGRAPSTSLSYWRTEAYFSHVDGRSTGNGSAEVGGGLGGGFWRARYEDDLSDDRRLLDYAWVRTDGRRRWLLGHQQVNAHSLLGSIELTGAQLAWTNRPEAMYADLLDAGELVSGRAAPASDIVGTGPVGGVAELRYEGIVVARVPIALDGRYEFRDIPLSHGTGTRVEVALFENGRLGVPVRIEDHSGQASDQLLAQGTVLHYLGAGRNGNPLDPEELREGVAAFYEARWGVAPGVTLDVAGQHVDGRDTWLAGGVFSLGAAGVYSAHVARSGDRGGWQVDGQGFRGHVYWRLLARDEDAGFRAHAMETPGSLYERYVETGWRGRYWALSVLGRDVERFGDDTRVRYLKPGVSWYPNSTLVFSARPDFVGDYQYSADWAATDRLRAGAFSSRDSDRYEIEYRLAGRWRAVAARTEYQRRARHSLLFARDRRAAGDVGLTVAALESEGAFGYLASVDATLVPGLSIRLQASDDPLLPGAGPVLQLGLTADFAVTPAGLVAGGFRRALGNVGGIAGALSVPGDDVAFDGAGATVWVDGQRRGTLDTNGRFHVDGLTPGVHRVKVDEGALPIELRLATSELWVEVRAGVVTAVDFPLELRLGFAGRVLDAGGDALPDRALVVEDAFGAVIAQPRSDAWGLYRVDGLRPGRYRLRIGEGTDPSGTWVELRDAFLFGIDLRVPR